MAAQKVEAASANQPPSSPEVPTLPTHSPYAALPDLVTLAEAASLLGESSAVTASLWRRRGWLPLGRRGKSPVFDRAQVLDTKFIHVNGRSRANTAHPSLVSWDGAAEVLRVNPKTLRARLRTWGVPFVRQGVTRWAPYRFDPATLREWMATREGRRALGQAQRSWAARGEE